MSKPVTHRVSRAAAAGLLALGVSLGATACGMNVQTLQPYTQADGVNGDVGGYNGVQVRSLSVIVDPSGTAFLSGAMISYGGDELTAVSGQALSQDNSPAGSFKVTLPGSKLALPPNQLVILTDGPSAEVSGVQLRPGLTANLNLTFATSGNLSLVVPVIDGAHPDYKSITPSPAASPSA